MELGGIEQEDIATLSEILESELSLHKRKCWICLVMFALAFLILIGVLVLAVGRIASSSMFATILSFDDKLDLFQVIIPIAGVALSFFGLWWSAQNCQNSIERALCAARNNRPNLFRAFLGEIQCASKKKQHAWLEIVKASLG